MLYVVSVLLAAIAIPIAINATFNVDTSGWDAGSVALWAITGLVIVAGFIIYLTGGLGGGRKGA